MYRWTPAGSLNHIRYDKHRRRTLEGIASKNVYSGCTNSHGDWKATSSSLILFLSLLINFSQYFLSACSTFYRSFLRDILLSFRPYLNKVASWWVNQLNRRILEGIPSGLNETNNNQQFSQGSSLVDLLYSFQVPYILRIFVPSIPVIIRKHLFPRLT